MAIRDPKNILIAPLDWGLGHTTRCVQLARYLQAIGHKVIFAGNEWQRTFIKASVNNIDTIDLGGYNIIYSRWNKVGQAGILSQIPGLQRTIIAEHKWIRKIAADLQLDGIISDNRYGLFHSDIPSVIMTHQLRVQSGLGSTIDDAVQRIHYKYLDRFDTTWVVDMPKAQGLGGILSHTKLMPATSRYIGLLSQFEEVKPVNDTDGGLLVQLSGPEPQRGDLSAILWKQVQEYKGKIVFIEGLDSVSPPDNIPAHITYHKWLANGQLAPILGAADIVICRSGYSTIMDLVALQKKAILIPTPGQTEQEYLGTHLHRQGIFYAAKQKGFDLVAALKHAEQFPFKSFPIQDHYSEYKQVIFDWVKTL